ncbi:MAG: flagellar biosynthesis protein FlhF [Nitrospirae bacterium]|jgi:flagellar biosynthesis protein FlhF|nr:flagellar biosynthesis protein FlhF [Nitrospirota bacterium]
MKIKKFRAKSFSEALTLVKKELSEDAIILSTEEKKGLKPYVEVTAAVDYESCQVEQKTGNFGQNINTQTLNNSKPVTDNFPVIDNTLSYLRNEIESLKETIMNMKNAGYSIYLPPEKKAVINYLTERAIRDEFAMRIAEKALNIDQIPSLIAKDIKVKSENDARKAIMLIGPTGVGKTTTIAKLSARDIKAGKKVAIINLDTYRIGAIEQIRIYTRIMGIPLSIVSSPKELEENLLRYMQTRDIVYIDTTGRNPRDETHINELLSVCKINVQIDIHLLISASCDDAFMIDAYRFYKKLPINYIDFTKIDEAVRFGSLYNLILTYQKPVSFITTGQKVPGDIEFVTPEKLLNLILQKRSYTC